MRGIISLLLTNNPLAKRGLVKAKDRYRGWQSESFAKKAFTSFANIYSGFFSAGKDYGLQPP